jgi:PST family polysaccharide transporter
MIFGPITPVLYSNLSRMNQDNKKIGDVAEMMVKALTFIAVPIGIVVFSVAGPIGDSIFGSEWQGIGAVIGIMALMHGFSWVVGMNGEFYRAMGKPSYETIVTATTLLIYLGVYLYSIRYGFDVFLWARLGLALGALVIHLFVMRKVLKVRVWAPLGYVLMISMVCGLAALLVKKLFTDGVSGPWWKLIGGGSLSCIAVAMALFIIERNGMFKEIKSMINGRSA